MSLLVSTRKQRIIRHCRDNDKLTPKHPKFKEWTRENMASTHATIPYHPGAIKFYKEKGVWTKEMEELQRKLLAL